MPVTYSFVTTLNLPTGTEFDCMDCRDACIPNVLLLDEVTASRGAPHFDFDAYDDLVIYSDDGVPSTLLFDLALQSDHTFETQFKPSSLPEDLAQLDKYRFFIGTFDKQDNASGILISRTGIALMAVFGTSALVLPGSQDIFEEGEDYYTLRLVVEGTRNLLHVYITKTDDLPTTGHILRYTSAAPVPPEGTTVDSIKIEILGNALKTVRGKFTSFRAACTSALIPNRRPIADPGADQTANVGSAVTHDGRNSYDPEEAPLTYDWALKDAPDGSRFKSSGTGGSTSDDGDANGFTTIFNGGTDAFSVDNMPLLQPGDHLMVEGVLYKVSTDRWVLDTATGRYSRNEGVTWDDDEVVVEEETIPDNYSDVTWDVYHSDTYFSDRAGSFPSAIPDKAGLYVVQLVVNDGELDSFAAEAILNVSQVSTAMGCIPDVSWIWNSLSDFWNLLEDREIVETVWSGFAQACAAQLLTAWQIDYNKSLIDIQRVFQRRWLSYSTLLDQEDLDTATIRVIRGPIFSDDIAGGANITGKSLQLVLDNGNVEEITFPSSSFTDPVPASDIAGRINSVMGFVGAVVPLASAVTVGAAEYLKLEYATLLQIRPNGTANTVLGFSTAAYEQNDLAGADGGIIEVTKVNAFTTIDVSTPAGPHDPPALDLESEGIQMDDLLVWDGESYRIQKVATDTATSTKRGLSMKDPLPDSGSASPPPYPDSNPWLIPSIVVSEDIDFEEEQVTAGDLARFEVKHTTTSVVTEVLCEIVGVRGYHIGFDPAPLLRAYAGTPGDYRTYFLGVKRINNIPVDDLVVEIPRLQEVIKNPTTTLEENTDYLINEDSEERNAIRFRDGTFSLTDPPPDLLWAEVTYLDNRPTIEANFGHLVNFKVEDLDTRTDDLDYLSAVRGLWWAYFGGPALQKVKVGTQILLGLPFSEAEGTILSIEPNFSATEGRIVIQDLADENIVRTYFYPLDAGLAVNDETGDVIAEGETIAQFAPLSGGVEVEDWESAALWMKKYVSQGKFHELNKFFRFLVRADVDTFNLTNLVFALDFVRKIKPTYTYPLFVLLKNLPPSEVDVTDEVNLIVHLSLFDTFCPDEPGSYRWDDSDESGNWNHTYDETPPPPRFLFDTHRLCPDEYVWVHISYIHPGGAGWFFDTIWAYDDGGGADLLPLSGPDHLPPAPYGPLVGTIYYDAGSPTVPPLGGSVVAGTYHRERIIEP
jgi:hypothetical protein